MEFLQQLDTQIFLFLNSLNIPAADHFVKLFSTREVWLPMYFMLLVITMKAYGWRRAAVIVAGVAILIALADQTCSTLIRPLVGRLRPSNPLNPISSMVHIVEGYRGGPHGFPSCHAANSVALAVYMCLLFKSQRFRITICSWAILNAYSRIYLGVHYPGDLLVGAAIGAGFAVIIYHLVHKIICKIPDGEMAGTELSADNLFFTFALPAANLRSAMGVEIIRFKCTDLAPVVALASVAVMMMC